MQWIARVSRAHIIIALTGVFAFASTFTYLQSLDKQIQIAQLSHDVKAGSAISPKDIVFIKVAGDDTIAKNTFEHEELEKNSLVARVDLSRNDLLTNSNTVRRTTKSGLQSLSIGIEADRANGGDIKKNDLIDIWQTGEEARIIARSVSVRNVILPDKRLGVATSKNITLVLAISTTQAKAISSVVGSDDIMIVLSTGTNSESNTEDSDLSALSTSSYEPLNLDDSADIGD